MQHQRPDSYLLRYRAEVVVPISIVPPPSRERLRRATSSEDGKRQDEEHREAGTVEGAGDQVRVVLEYARAVVPKVKLGVKPGNDLTEDDTGLARVVGYVTRVLDELREVELVCRDSSNAGDELDCVVGSRVRYVSLETWEIWGWGCRASNDGAREGKTHVSEDPVDKDQASTNC